MSAYNLEQVCETTVLVAFVALALVWITGIFDRPWKG